MKMSNLLIALSTLIAMSSCGNDTKANTNTKDKTLATNTTEAPADVVILSGVTEVNKDSKKGKVALKMTFNKSAKGEAFLYTTEGKNYYQLSSAPIVEGTADFGNETYDTGFYMVALNGNENNLGVIIINPAEKEVHVTFPTGRLESRLTSVNSKENQGWSKYSVEEKKYLNTINEQKKSLRKSSIKGKIQQQIDAKEKELFAYRESIIKEFPNTYLAKIVGYKQNPYENDISKYWSDLDMNDESLIRSSIVSDRIQNFMIVHSGATEQGFMKCVDLTKQAMEENPKMLEFGLYTMLDGFYKSKKENICSYIYDNYILDEDCGAELGDVMKSRAEGVMNLQIGKVPENIAIPSHITGGNVDLYNLAQSNEYTLVMFWSSWCHKCEQEIPVLKNVYNTYKSKGFEVLSVSMDTQRQAWLDAIKKNGMPWPNGSELMQWNSKSAKDYRVTQTPTLFLINSKKEIVLKPERIFEVEAYLKANL